MNWLKKIFKKKKTWEDTIKDFSIKNTGTIKWWQPEHDKIKFSSTLFELIVSLGDNTKKTFYVITKNKNKYKLYIDAKHYATIQLYEKKNKK